MMFIPPSLESLGDFLVSSRIGFQSSGAKDCLTYCRGNNADPGEQSPENDPLIRYGAIYPFRRREIIVPAGRFSCVRLNTCMDIYSSNNNS
ncbi:MAG: hypothetical protein HKM93_08805 [Desulfobacteraceae bacterium]|nr:hypothetical protein [Desulfobacteraceae bacterium]